MASSHPAAAGTTRCCPSRHPRSETARQRISYLGDPLQTPMDLKFKGEPEHFACPNCINHRRIEILQDNRTTRGKYRCTAAGCGAEFPINPQQWPKAGTADGVGPGNWM